MFYVGQPPVDHVFVKTTGSQAAAAARIGARLAGRKLGELAERLRSCFQRIEPFVQACKYMRAVASEMPKRNGWTIAEYVGDRTPDKTQRLLNRACWDEAEAMTQIRRFAVSGLQEAARKGGRRRGKLVIGALDETGQQKKGDSTAGVKRQHMGCAGRVENGFEKIYGTLKVVNRYGPAGREAVAKPRSHLYRRPSKSRKLSASSWRI